MHLTGRNREAREASGVSCWREGRQGALGGPSQNSCPPSWRSIYPTERWRHRQPRRGGSLTLAARFAASAPSSLLRPRRCCSSCGWCPAAQEVGVRLQTRPGRSTHLFNAASLVISNISSVSFAQKTLKSAVYAAKFSNQKTIPLCLHRDCKSKGINKQILVFQKPILFHLWAHPEQQAV